MASEGGWTGEFGMRLRPVLQGVDGKKIGALRAPRGPGAGGVVGTRDAYKVNTVNTEKVSVSVLLGHNRPAPPA